MSENAIFRPADVVRNEEGVLPRVRFGEMKRHFARIERLGPVAVRARAHETDFPIEHVLVRLRPREVAVVIRGLAEAARDFGDAPIVVRVFEHFRD